MANRPVFKAVDIAPYVKREPVEFRYYNGFSLQQKQRTIDNLHEAYLKRHAQDRILEISTKSKDLLGIKLSAFNLSTVLKDGRVCSVEQIFQSSKVFEFGGPYTDLLGKSPGDAKKDERLRNSGRLVRFEFGTLTFEPEPKTYFYCWLYINILAKNQVLSEAILCYDAFSDTEFNPEKSINCQAEAAAMYVGLCRSGKLEDALKDRSHFLNVVYQHEPAPAPMQYRQLNIFNDLS